MPEMNVFSIVFFAVYVFQFAFSIWIEKLNLDHIKHVGDRLPPELGGLVSSEELARINAYTVDKSRLFLGEKIAMDVAMLAILVTGFLPWLGGYTEAVGFNEIFAGFLFFLAVGAIFSVLVLPFDWYHTFVIEDRYGFNRYDTQTWVLDLIKGACLSAGLLAIVIIPVLWVIRAYPQTWWIFAFAIVSLGELIIMVLYPVLIVPIFNKLEPLEDKELTHKVQALVQRAGMKSRGIVQMDAGRRSTHSNAYVAGLGRSKRIVLFDTLINTHTHNEILAILSHELGHSKYKHIMKSFAWTLLATLVGFYVTYLLMSREWVYTTFGISRTQPYLSLFVISIGLRKTGYFLRPIAMASSRRFEKQADAFAAHIRESAEDLITALKKMAVHNLSNLNPHPLYVWVNYSHPPIPERISRLITMNRSSTQEYPRERNKKQTAGIA